MPEPELQAPVAAFTADGQAGEAPFTVEFTNESTGTISGFAWSFGDGDTSQDEAPSHAYASPGNYTVSLTVFNEAGSDTTTYRIDVTAPAELALPEQNETLNDLIPSIRRMLRGPSDAKLHYKDIQDVLNDLLRGYSRDLNVTEQNQRTNETQCVLNRIDGSDWILTVPGVADVEALALMYTPKDEQQGPSVIWREVDIVPLDYYAERHMLDAALGSFYGGMVVDSGVKIKLNLSAEAIEDSIWKVRYRVPMLRLVSLAAKTPLPSDFIPMLKTEAALMCLPRVKDDSEAFYSWRKANEPLFAASIADWRRRWDDYCNTSTEPTHVRQTPFNHFRSNRRRSPGYTVVRGTPTE